MLRPRPPNSSLPKPNNVKPKLRKRALKALYLPNLISHDSSTETNSLSAPNISSALPPTLLDSTHYLDTCSCPTFHETCPTPVPSDLITQQSTPTRGFLKQRRPRTEFEQRPGNCILSVSDSLNVKNHILYKASTQDPSQLFSTLFSITSGALKNAQPSSQNKLNTIAQSFFFSHQHFFFKLSSQYLR